MPEKDPGERERSAPICARGCRHCPWYQKVCQRLCACQDQRTHTCTEIREFTCTQRTHKHAHKHKSKHSRAHTGELAKGSDRESLNALIDLKFDPVPRVVEAVVAAISKIVAGRAQDNGTLASFVGISPAANSRHVAHSKRLQPSTCLSCSYAYDAHEHVCGHVQAYTDRCIQMCLHAYRRLPSATRRLQPLPSRPLVTREWMDKEKDLDGDGWHAYVYWSQCFLGGPGEPPNPRAMQTVMHSKDAVDASGIPGWIYTQRALKEDIVLAEKKELAELEKEMKEKHAAEHEALYEKLVWEKEQATVKKRIEQDKELRAKERERPWFSFAADDEEPEQSIFEEQPTAEMLEEQKRKREAAIESRLMATNTFETELEFMAQKHTANLRKLTKEKEDYMDMMLKALEEDNEELLEKKKAKLVAMQERRQLEAVGEELGGLVWDIVLQRLAESEIFVACLTDQYLRHPVCRKEVIWIRVYVLYLTCMHTCIHTCMHVDLRMYVCMYVWE